MAEDVDWTVEGTHPLAGRYHSKAEFLAVTFSRLKGVLVGSARLEVQHLLGECSMKRISVPLFVAAACIGGSMPFAAPGVDEAASPIFGVEIPPGYRDWGVISVAHEAGNNNDLRVILGNDVAIKAYREGKLPYPDGTMIARLAWSYVPSEENNKVFGRAQSFVAGSPINLQLSVKDSRKYASTGGWGFGQFKDGKPADEAVHITCFPCHEPAKARDFVYTRYSPSP